MKTKLNLILFIFFGLSFKSNAQELYTNKEFDFSVVAPKGWHTLHHKDIKKPLRGNHAMQDLITYYKNANNVKDKVNPTINMYVVENSFKTIEQFNKKMSRRRYNTNLTNYSLKLKPQLLTIGGKYGVFETSTYVVDNYLNGEKNVKRRLYVFPTKDFLYYVSLIDERESEENTTLFKALVESIKIQSN